MYLLLIEDNPDLIENLCEFLESQGHIVDIAYNGLSGLGFALDNSYDVIILDLTLPGMDGLEVCSRLRREGHDTPVLMLTARDTLQDKLEGFASGTDDYLVKPFALPELAARLGALSRRSRSEMAQRRLEVEDLRFDPDTLRVERNGQRIELAPIPLKILALLMRRSPGVVRRMEIEREIWGDDPPDSDTLRAHMHALRAAIDRHFEPPLLHTIRGMGYQLCGPDGR
ncbi:response regulator transcription factor [Sedimenticola thiotaurini]|uniref:XRE family transcriptional regulator n=1 Tax=Sedimenticola thiotaurini TaxID=1543721 RepID=A0A0F7JSG5_9GAMM|nr:response regulator transcription factor [Sedimenticola thiotaurini]AKH19421.1 XRE family transcriptional regulator [Sedimenticola thiotaurini]